MSRWGYFSPAILGAVAAVIYAVFGRGDYTQTDRIFIAAIAAPSVALTGQLLMLATQGIFAGVLPVPFGKTLRGGKCVAVGILLLTGMVLGVVAYLVWPASAGTLKLVLAGTSAACLLAALGIYGWSLPTATSDFCDETVASRMG